MRLEVGASSARLVDLAAPDSVRLAIVENAPLERLLFDRNQIGHAFRQSCYESVRLMLEHVVDELRDEPPAELVILSKGLAYQLAAAFEDATGISPAINLIATQRGSVEGKEADIDVIYDRLDAGGASLVIGDTIASGATMTAVLDAYRRQHDLTEVVILSLAGSIGGATRLAEYAERHGIALTLIYGLAAFGLGDNGFDLSFLHPDTVTSARYVERASLQFDGKPASSVGWDFGSQWMSPDKYRALCGLEAEYWDLQGHPAFALADAAGASLLSEAERGTLPSR